MARRILAIAAVGWFVVSAWLLLSPSVPAIAIDITSTWAHVLTFFWMAFAALGFAMAGGKNVRTWAMALVAIGIASELSQASFVIGRQGSLSDAVADTVGVALAGGLLGLLVALLSKRRALRLTALLTLFSLLAALAMIVASNPTVGSWWACRSHSASADGPLLSFDSSDGLAGELAADSTALACTGAESGEMRWVVEFTSDTASQDGPTRIVTSSVGSDENQVNFHIGQAGTNLSVRLRTDDARDREWETIANAIEPGERQRVEVAIRNGLMQVWVDDVERGSFSYDEVDFGLWSPEYPVLAGSEASGEREFVGVVHSVQVFGSLDRTS